MCCFRHFFIEEWSVYLMTSLEQIAGNVKSWVVRLCQWCDGVVRQWCQPGGRGHSEDYHVVYSILNDVTHWQSSELHMVSGANH